METVALVLSLVGNMIGLIAFAHISKEVDKLTEALKMVRAAAKESRWKHEGF